MTCYLVHIYSGSRYLGLASTPTRLYAVKAEAEAWIAAQPDNGLGWRYVIETCHVY